jgi:sugar/nucleoside kinase (ribokinase family)
VVITAGENGARAYIPVERSEELSSLTAPTMECNIQHIEQRTKHVQVVDSTGCGDAFAAGFLYSWKVS